MREEDAESGRRHLLLAAQEYQPVMVGSRVEGWRGSAISKGSRASYVRVAFWESARLGAPGW